MRHWQEDKQLANRHLPEVKTILGRYFIGEASAEEDAEHNTDLIVLKMEVIRFACRIRSATYLQSYADEFTIRTSRPVSVAGRLGVTSPLDSSHRSVLMMCYGALHDGS